MLIIFYVLCYAAVATSVQSHAQYLAQDLE